MTPSLFSFTSMSMNAVMAARGVNLCIKVQGDSYFFPPFAFMNGVKMLIRQGKIKILTSIDTRVNLIFVA